jgi:hypothetical protein
VCTVSVGAVGRAHQQDRLLLEWLGTGSRYHALCTGHGWQVSTGSLHVQQAENQACGCASPPHHMQCVVRVGLVSEGPVVMPSAAASSVAVQRFVSCTNLAGRVHATCVLHVCMYGIHALHSQLPDTWYVWRTHKGHMCTPAGSVALYCQAHVVCRLHRQLLAVLATPGHVQALPDVGSTPVVCWLSCGAGA